MKSSPTLFIVAALGLSLAAVTKAQDLDAAPPVVVKCTPEAGSNDVAPGIVEIKVTFSKPMVDQSWSWTKAWPDSAPEIVEPPKYDGDHKTCIVKVKLEPGKTYGYWLNSEKFQGFRDPAGHAAVPYLLVFRTRDR